MITKIGNEFLNGAKSFGKAVGKDLVSPLGLALSTFGVASGTQSVGENLGMSVGAIAANKAYNAFTNKHVLGLEKRLSKVPGKWGSLARGALATANGIAGLAIPGYVGMKAGEIAGKYAPIYKRPSVLQ